MQTAATAPRRTLSIRTALLGTVAGLSLLSTVGFGWMAAKDWVDLREAHVAQAADASANRFAAGLFTVLLERLTTNNALQGAAPASPELLRAIAEHRGNALREMQAGLEGLTRVGFANREALLRELEAANARANAARRRADEALRLPREARDAALLRDFVPEVTASVTAAMAVWFAASHAAASTDPVLARLASVKEIGWRLREVAGYERSNIASAMAAGQPVAADRLAANAGFRAQVDLLWSQVQNLAPEADPATHPALRAAAQGAQREYFQAFRRLTDEMARAGAQAPGGRYPIPSTQYVETTNPQLGSLLEVLYAGSRASEARAAELVAGKQRELAIAFGLLAVALLVAGAASWLVLRRVTRPLGGLAGATARLAEGRLETEVPGTARMDEVGAVARALEMLRDGARRARELEAAAAAERAARDRRQAEMERHTEAFGGSVAGVMESLGAASRAMRGAADSMAGAVARTRQGAESTVGGAEESARNLAAVASATEELTASVGEIARRVAQAAEMAREADDRARATDSTVRGLSEAAGQIGEVVKLITGIAEQTNLLALNATIEAARAGEAGKGFAVVASEVKQLASQTARATEQIGTQIAAIQSVTEQAVTAVREVGTSITQVSEAASAIAAAVEEQGAATREIAASVQTVAGQNEQATVAMREVVAAVEGADGDARAVLSVSEEVSRVSGTLEREVAQFLEAMRTGEGEGERRAA